MKILIALLILCSLSFSRSHAADFQSLIQDTQKITQEDGVTQLVWWVPLEFWDFALSQDTTVTDEQRQVMLSAHEDYTTMVVVHIKTGPFGGMTFKTRDEMKKALRVSVDDKPLKELELSELNPDAANFFTLMKPMMTQMLGQFGSGLEFFTYLNKADDEFIVTPKTKGELSVTCFDKDFTWRLPLGSFLPPKIDPETGETFPGNYLYNPFTGEKLEEKQLE